MTEDEVRWDWNWPSDQTLALSVAFWALAVPGWYAAATVFVGMARAGSAQGKRDPISRAVLRRDRRR